MRTIDADALKKAFTNSEHIKETASGLDVMEMLAIKEIIDNAPTCNNLQGEYVDISKLRLMTVEECAGHTIDYAMGWKACIEWIKGGVV